MKNSKMGGGDLDYCVNCVNWETQRITLACNNN